MSISKRGSVKREDFITAMSIHTRHTPNALTLLLTAVSLILFSASAEAASSRKNPTSKLYVADVEGISSINTGDKIEDLTQKSVYSAEGTILETEPDSSNAIVLSNGTGICFDPDTRLEVKRFVQEPFSPNRTDLDVEPSVSQTSVFLPRGTVGLCTSKLVAGSTMNYATPQANISIRGRKVVIECTDSSTVVSVLEGEVTVSGSQMAGGQSLKSGQQAIITKSSAFSPPSITMQPIPQSEIKDIEKKAALACMARKTVYFDEAERKMRLDIFAEDDEAPPDIIPVEVIPGSIPTDQTVSPFKIGRTAPVLFPK
jgi:hypothetical protein